MGIHGLMKLLSEECPQAIKEVEMDNLTGRKIAIDASMALYQFLVAVRSGGSGQASAQLTNEAGEVTSHIQGMFNRTIKMMVSGCKPCYVFDGKPPEMKGGELAKRLAKRKKAEKDLNAATESGDLEDMDKFSRRLVKVTPQHNADCKHLLKLMGVPYVESPCEAEAQCAELAKHNKVYATATEDMDALTFRTPKLLRRFTFSQGKEKQAILEIDCEVMLVGLDLTYEQFIDLCILCGCDYCGTIKGIGPKTALKLIKEHHTLEAIVKALKKGNKKYQVPPDWTFQKVLKEEYEAALKAVADEEEKQRKEREEEKIRKENELKEIQSHSMASNNEEVIVTNEITKEEVMAVNGEVVVTPIVTDNVEIEDEIIDMPIVDEQDIVLEEEEEEEDIVENTTTTTTTTTTTAIHEDIDADADTEDGKYVIIAPLYIHARSLFITSDVTNASEVELKWSEPDEAGLRDYLVTKMGFSLDRVNSSIKRLQDAQGKKSQKRMDCFFAPIPGQNVGVKRKVEPVKGKGKGAPGGKKGPPSKRR
jgi:flap endonuclease-1